MPPTQSNLATSVHGCCLGGRILVVLAFLSRSKALFWQNFISQRGFLFAMSQFCARRICFWQWPKAIKLRFISNPDVPGVEKISATRVPKEYLEAAYDELPSTIGGPFTFIVLSNSQRKPQVKERKKLEISCLEAAPCFRPFQLDIAKDGRDQQWLLSACKESESWKWLRKFRTVFGHLGSFNS